METLGQKLRAAREKKRITLSKAAASTRIKIQNLEMMENDDFSKVPAPTYAKGFIRIYATFLGLDPAPLVQEYVDVHLNGPAGKPARAGTPEPVAAPETDSAARASLPASWPAFVAAIKRISNSIVDSLRPHAFKIGIALGIVVLVMLVSRCVSDPQNGGEPHSDQLMRDDAIAREPADQYLELPAGEKTP